MTAPVVASYNSNLTIGGDSCWIGMTNAPPAGGIVVVLAAAYSGTGGGSWSCTQSGGTGVTITERYNPLGTTNSVSDVLIWTVEYSTAPTSLTVTRNSAGTSPRISVACVNVTGQAASYLDGCNGSTATSATPVATALPDLTDATDLVLGVMSRNSADGTTIAAGTNWTEIVELDEGNATYQTLNAIQRTPGATGAYDPTWTLGGSPGTDAWYAGGISIKGTAGGGGQAPRSMHQFKLRRH